MPNRKPTQMNLNPQATKFPHQKLIVKRWLEPQQSNISYSIQSGYVERFWLPIIGPTTTLLVRLLDRELAMNNGVLWIDCFDMSKQLGLGNKGGRNSPLWRSLMRANRFSIAYVDENTLYLKKSLPQLKAHQIESLPQNLAHEHQHLYSLPVAEHVS